MPSPEPLPPGAEPDDKETMDEFLHECIQDFQLVETLQMNNRDNDGNASDDSQKTVDFDFEILKKMKEEQRSRSSSPNHSSKHPRIEPPVDVKPDKRLLDERIERQRSRRSRSTSRSRSSRTQGSNSSRDRRQRSRERSQESRDRSRRRSPIVREDRKPHSYSRSNTTSRRSKSPSPARRTQHTDKRRRSRSRSRSRSRDRRDRHRSPPKWRRDRSRSRSPARPAPRPRNGFLEEMMKKGVVSRDDAANALISADIARTPVINPAAVQLPMIGLNPMVAPSLVSYTSMHHLYGVNPPAPVYMLPPTREVDQGRALRALIEQEAQVDLQAKQQQQQRKEVLARLGPKSATTSTTMTAASRSFEAEVDDNEDAGSSTDMLLSDYLMMTTKGLSVSARSTASSSSRKAKVLTRCISSINALERYERCQQNAQFLQVPLAEPPEFAKISGRSPLIVNRHNVLFRTTSVSNNVDFSQPFKNISHKIGTIVKTVGLDPSEISRKIQEREEEDRRILANRRLVKAEQASNETMRNDIGVQTDETKCERCMILDLKTYRSTATQKSTITSESSCQTSDMLATPPSVSNLTPAQLRIIEQLLLLMESDTTAEQLKRFVTGSFGQNNQNNWRQVLDDNQQSYRNGGSVIDGNGYDNDGDFEMTSRPGPGPPAGFREAPQPSSNRGNQGMRSLPGNSNLHSMLNRINGRREPQQQRRQNNSFPNNRYYQYNQYD